LTQIGALSADKAKRTPAQKKIDSQLIYAARARSGRAAVSGAPRLRASVETLNNGLVEVDISAKVTPGLLQQILNAGGTVSSSFAQFNAIRAQLPLGAIETLAARPDVRFIKRAAKRRTHAVRNLQSTPAKTAPTMKTAPRALSRQTAKRAANAALRLATTKSAGSTRSIGPRAGSVTSEGDVAHRADEARTTFNVDGTGVKIGVISDSVDHLAAAQQSGNVPDDLVVLTGQEGTGKGEGTAMLEIVHDLAPGAKLYFATAGDTPAQFAQNILDLRTAGCDIIVDDITFNDESPFQAGVIERAVQTVSAQGTLYFSSVGNSGNKNDNTSGTWQGDFVNGGTATSPPYNTAGNLHNFGGATFTQIITLGSQSNALLFWSDPLGASTNDYDLYLLDGAGAVISASDTTQDGTQDPMEIIEPVALNNRIVIVKTTGAANRYLQLTTEDAVLNRSTHGATRGHNAPDAANGFSVAATSAAANAPFEGGATNPVETYSSDGPRRLFYEANGTAITPGNFSATGGRAIQAPNITAADEVTTSTPGFETFPGTSAAAPHAAAIAGLLLSYNPILTPAQVRTLLQDTALDIEAPGVDRDSGHGIIMAFQALDAAPAPNQVPQMTINNATVTEGNTGTATATFTVTLSAAATEAVTVQYATANGTATAGTDYTAKNGTLTIPIGQTTGTITVSVTGDTVIEPNETFRVNLSNANGATITGAQGTGTITNDDTTPPSGVSVSINSVTVTEGNTGTVNATFTVTLSKASAETVAVSAISYNGSARSPGDYTSTGSRLTFEPGQISKTFVVPVQGDLMDEINEIFYAVLSSPTNCSIGTGRGVGTINDNDATPSITIDNISVKEYNAGQTTAALRLSLSAASGKAVSVSYATANGTTNPATGGSDYVAVAPTVITFNVGNRYAYARVLINGDVLNEKDETFLVNLTNPVNATIADNQAIGTILNDDSAPALLINDVEITEGDSGTKNLTFTVTLSKASGQNITVNYATADGIARSTSDYVAKNGTLTFAPGSALTRTISVAIRGDLLVENDETFYVFLSGATNASIGKARGVGTILDDDASE
jgi:hypothetical protein